MEKWFNVGKIVNTHGIKGELKVLSMTDFPEERYQKGNELTLFIEGKEPKSLTIASYRKHKNFDLLMFEGYSDINEVEGFKQGILKVDESQLQDLDEGEFYFHEIIGCVVRTTSGEELGVVKEILSPGANDVWVVKAPRGKEHLIPYIEDIVKKVDIAQKEIIIEPMEGLLS
ncbi:ribosome maturation factor RimM [Rossellomorea marisflavi]|uniref:Ribosome maturation factor RimM n=1 Tax=Rossellomorea marisflavi TaxID=189381 RepID=A0A5D4RWA0_9BACI|nr:ribosome maturation factor RimM [Rossellomorea marisflavi]KQU60394.1 16S rRNA processing protein RimM [Bacillus sp. Leaf406]MDW4526468.1 ribosome maturation factor RimM [Rossellomorea marisflavi]TYS53902.1 ribosome maturation factor RimM [Rossellomorea marisflavi]UKS67114.1 ribosome maturation factor RimM [Rossellomorea marisflavi]WJV17146.1 ribosome maturation factor RimM [Rossellomorea marisflavi]